jgi:hypothetical protein
MIEMKTMIAEARKQVPMGELEFTAHVYGEFVVDGVEEDKIYDGHYVLEIRVDENDKIDNNYSCVRIFISDDGEKIDPMISMSEISDFDNSKFEIIEVLGK